MFFLWKIMRWVVRHFEFKYNSNFYGIYTKLIITCIEFSFNAEIKTLKICSRFNDDYNFHQFKITIITVVKSLLEFIKYVLWIKTILLYLQIYRFIQICIFWVFNLNYKKCIIKLNLKNVCCVNKYKQKYKSNLRNGRRLYILQFFKITSLSINYRKSCVTYYFILVIIIMILLSYILFVKSIEIIMAVCIK